MSSWRKIYRLSASGRHRWIMPNATGRSVRRSARCRALPGLIPLLLTPITGWASSRSRSKRSRACLKIVEQTGEERLAALVRASRAGTYAEMGDFEAAWIDVDYVRERATATGLGQVWGWGFGCQIAVLAAEERWEEVLRVSQECFEKLGYRNQYFDALAYVSLDRREELEALIRAGLLDDKPGLKEQLPWVFLIRAMIQAYLGERQVAVEYFDKAIADFKRRGGKIGLARSILPTRPVPAGRRAKQAGPGRTPGRRRSYIQVCGAKPRCAQGAGFSRTIGKCCKISCVLGVRCALKDFDRVRQRRVQYDGISCKPLGAGLLPV